MADTEPRQRLTPTGLHGTAWTAISFVAFGIASHMSWEAAMGLVIEGLVAPHSSCSACEVRSSARFRPT
jgi:hypothetical protein